MRQSHPKPPVDTPPEELITRAAQIGFNEGRYNRHWTQYTFFTAAEYEAWLSGWRQGQEQWKFQERQRTVDLAKLDRNTWKAVREMELRGLLRATA